jgi:RimJ/RimL family protein N-acetyltransferase
VCVRARRCVCCKQSFLNLDLLQPVTIGRLEERVEAVIISSGRVVLRAFRDDELDAALSGLKLLPPTARPSRMPSPAVYKRKLASSGTMARGRLDLAIEASGRLVGDIQARGSHPNRLPEGVFEIGIAIYDPADRGHGFGSESIRALCDWLFDQAGAERIQASTAQTNVSMQRCFERLGFRNEGILRAFWPSEDGGREDFILYATTREDRARQE